MPESHVTFSKAIIKRRHASASSCLAPHVVNIGCDRWEAVLPRSCYRLLGRLSSNLGILFRNSARMVALHLPRYEVLIDTIDFKFCSTLLDEFCCYPICSQCSVIFKLLNSYLQFFKHGEIYFLSYWSSYKLYIFTVCGSVFLLVIVFTEEVIEIFIPSCQHLVLIADGWSIFCLTYIHPRFKFFLSFLNFTVKLFNLPSAV